MTIYSIDTGALIDLERLYSHETFPSVWNRFESIVTEGRVVAARAVRGELEFQKDYIWRWSKAYLVFNDPDKEQLEVVSNIVNNFPGLVPLSKTSDVADPFVIALAKVKNHTVITTEIPDPNKHKIPGVCDDLDVPWVNLQRFFKTENWVI